MLTGRFTEAFEMATRLHGAQVRKGTLIPYRSVVEILRGEVSEGIVGELDQVMRELETVVRAE